MTPVRLNEGVDMCTFPLIGLQIYKVKNSNLFQCAYMNQACEELPTIPKIPEEGREEKRRSCILLPVASRRSSSSNAPGPASP